ncbi:Mad1/Cdc20-bound-Mad2 binding protein [Dioscorea alata]|uniref:Mad1/Cdc20-bound-Mad2 binding protein n=3 Tax=Dioscorea alata TaxID=55571 RepID=A0ACB7VVR4_DIOAL|nr:Mad1/Cdc20-bound-Mad2 binding protein [Dioscorea alata]
MESTGEGGGGGALGFTEIETAAEALGRDEIAHIVKEILGFVLYMHRQIPSVLQNLEREFDALKEEHKGLEEEMVAGSEELRGACRRKRNWRKREVKRGIKRLEKLMNSVSSLISGFREAIDRVPEIQSVALILGGSLLRPRCVYELELSSGGFDSCGARDCSKTKLAQALSRKAIRALISNGAGSSSYLGPTKLYLMVKCSSALNLPMHFLPKRDFKYPKKVVPFKLHIKCKTSSIDCDQNEIIWFQCKHAIKGIPCNVPPEG